MLEWERLWISKRKRSRCHVTHRCVVAAGQCSRHHLGRGAGVLLPPQHHREAALWPGLWLEDQTPRSLVSFHEHKVEPRHKSCSRRDVTFIGGSIRLEKMIAAVFSRGRNIEIFCGNRTVKKYLHRSIIIQIHSKSQKSKYLWCRQMAPTILL